MSDFLMLVGNEIRNTRIKQGLTIEELAEMTGLSTSYLGRIELGKLNITMLTLEKIVISLNISPSKLFEFSDINQSNNHFLNNIMYKHEQMLKKRAKNEIETIHNITQEIISLIDNKCDWGIMKTKKLGDYQ